MIYADLTGFDISTETLGETGIVIRVKIQSGRALECAKLKEEAVWETEEMLGNGNQLNSRGEDRLQKMTENERVYRCFKCKLKESLIAQRMPGRRSRRRRRRSSDSVL